jgi:hypothetical protein
MKALRGSLLGLPLLVVAVLGFAVPPALASGTTGVFAAGVVVPALSSVPPAVVTEAASGALATTATLNGTVNPEGETLTSCTFEYGPEVSYGQSVGCAQSVGEGTSPVPVSAELAGLEPNVLYHFRLTAGNEHGLSEGQDGTFTTLAVPPTAEGGSVSDVTPTSATLTAQVDPNGTDTTYYFQYGTSSSYGSSAPAAPGRDIGSGHAAQSVSATPLGLQPGTLYHYRVVAVSSAGTSKGPDGTFTTFPPASQFALPDGRVYEQATPVDKNGVSASGFTDAVQAASDGSAITFQPAGTMSGDTGTANIPEYIATRGTDGWSTRGLLPPASAGEIARLLGLSPDLSEVFTEDQYNQSEVVPGDSFYLQDSISGSLQTVASSVQGGGYMFADATPDGSHVLFETSNLLASNAALGQSSVYEWDRATGVVSLAGVLPDGSVPAGGSAAGYKGVRGGYTQNTISDDGSRVFFTDNGTGQLYVREKGTTTIAVSGAVSGEPAMFDVATRDGEYVFFTVEGDLYRFDVATGQATLLYDGGVEGVVGVSDDGSYAYFAAGGGNLSVWHDDEVGFIARLPESPREEGENSESWDWTPKDRQAAGPYEKTGFVAPDGRTLLFSSRQRLTGYDNSGFAELYRYDASTGGLSCVSCDPTGAPPVGDATVQDIQRFAYFEREFTGNASFHNKTQTRNLADDGKRIFFESADALVPQDTNGVRDVYEWEADGTGSCRSETQNGGCLYLISTGHDPEPSFFADASESGDDVFFFTSQSLVRQDQDQLVDIYDARVDGGIPAQNALPTPPCAGEACKLPLPGLPSEQSSASSGFSGPGNPPAVAAAGLVTVKSLTRAQKLAAALRVCRRKPRRRRTSCERQARRRYGATVRSTRGGAR